MRLYKVLSLEEKAKPINGLVIKEDFSIEDLDLIKQSQVYHISCPNQSQFKGKYPLLTYTNMMCSDPYFLTT